MIKSRDVNENEFGGLSNAPLMIMYNNDYGEASLKEVGCDLLCLNAR